MPTQEEMHSLTQWILNSYEARVASIASLRQEVTSLRQASQAELRELGSTRQAMARQQRADLAKGHSDLVKAEAQRKPEVTTWMEDVASARQAMAREQRADLAKGRADLRKAEPQRKSEVRTWVKEVAIAHQAMARQQKDDLAKGRAQLAKAEAQRKPEVTTWMEDVASARQAMAREQRADLAKGRADLREADAEREAEISAWVKEVASGRAGAREEWQRLSATMQAKRGVLVVERPPEAAAPPAPEEVAAPPAVEEAVEEAAVAETPKFATLRGQVFAYLADHPDGTRMTELETEFGGGRIQMARVIKMLTDEGKVKKQDLLYFAI